MFPTTYVTCITYGYSIVVLLRRRKVAFLFFICLKLFTTKINILGSGNNNNNSSNRPTYKHKTRHNTPSAAVQQRLRVHGAIILKPKSVLWRRKKEGSETPRRTRTRSRRNVIRFYRFSGKGKLKTTTTSDKAKTYVIELACHHRLSIIAIRKCTLISGSR